MLSSRENFHLLSQSPESTSFPGCHLLPILLGHLHDLIRGTQQSVPRWFNSGSLHLPHLVLKFKPGTTPLGSPGLLTFVPEALKLCPRSPSSSSGLTHAVRPKEFQIPSPSPSILSSFMLLQLFLTMLFNCLMSQDLYFDDI